MPEVIALSAGYNFGVVVEKSVDWIDKEPTGQEVFFKGCLYPVYKATTFEESQKVDRVLDQIQEFPLKTFLV